MSSGGLSRDKFPHACVAQGAEEDVEMADAPDEYLDPITYTLMQDPVKLPSGAVMDRPNVMRMLLSDPRDPTTRLARIDTQHVWCATAAEGLLLCSSALYMFYSEGLDAAAFDSRP